MMSNAEGAKVKVGITAVLATQKSMALLWFNCATAVLYVDSSPSTSVAANADADLLATSCANSLNFFRGGGWVAVCDEVAVGYSRLT